MPRFLELVPSVEALMRLCIAGSGSGPGACEQRLPSSSSCMAGIESERVRSSGGNILLVTPSYLASRRPLHRAEIRHRPSVADGFQVSGLTGFGARGRPSPGRSRSTTSRRTRWSTPSCPVFLASRGGEHNGAYTLVCLRRLAISRSREQHGVYLSPADLPQWVEGVFGALQHCFENSSDIWRTTWIVEMYSQQQLGDAT